MPMQHTGRCTNWVSEWNWELLFLTACLRSVLFLCVAYLAVSLFSNCEWENISQTFTFLQMLGVTARLGFMKPLLELYWKLLCRGSNFRMTSTPVSYFSSDKQVVRVFFFYFSLCSEAIVIATSPWVVFRWLLFNLRAICVTALILPEKLNDTQF